jgi:hypothetical protein
LERENITMDGVCGWKKEYMYKKVSKWNEKEMLGVDG